MAVICQILLSIYLLTLKNINALPQVPAIAPIQALPIQPIPRTAFPPPLPPPGTFIPIVQQIFDINPDGSGYTFGYQSADGSARQETGAAKFSNVPGVDPILTVQGIYSYTSPDGQQVEVQYIADENGFQPSGPGIHPAIQKAVALQVAEAKAQLGLPINVNGALPRAFPAPLPPPPPPPPPPPVPFNAIPTPIPFRPTRR